MGHEVGHAVQDAEGYRWLQLRMRSSEVAGRLAPWSSLVFVGGVMLGIPLLIGLGGLILAVSVVVTLVSC